MKWFETLREKYKMFRLRRRLNGMINLLVRKGNLPESYRTEMTKERFERMIKAMRDEEGF